MKVPPPPMANYDSKSLIRFNPGDTHFNPRFPITVIGVHQRSGLLFFAFPISRNVGDPGDPNREAILRPSAYDPQPETHPP
jgi:hypothetical protein